MKNALLAVGVVAVIVYLFVPIKTRWTPPGPDVKIIQFWHGWTGEYADALQEVIAEFNRTHPHIQAQPLFMPTGAGENLKFFSAVAGGVPPDVVVVDGTEVASWADLGVLRRLDDYLAQAGITASDYFEPSWKQCRYHDKTWALSACADPNFALVWNKHLFRQAGLDPERPPRTLEELEEYALKLTKFDEQGRIEQLGFLPTHVPHGSIAVLTWGWAFGGRFYDPETEEFTCDDPRVVEALEWILHLQEQYGGYYRILDLEASFGFTSQHPFNVGNLAMNISYISLTQEIAKFAPNLEYGIGRMPVKKGVDGTCEWIGGWTMAIPYGSRRHNEDEAFELIRWMCADKAGTTYMARTMRLLPAYRKSPFFKKDVPGNHILEVYYDILKRAKHSRPITPASAVYMRELLRALGQVRTGQRTPEEALKQAKEQTTKEWHKMQSRTKPEHTL